MYRLFQNHNIRKTVSLPTLWELSIKDDKPIKMPIPACVESLPQYSSYKGECNLKAEQKFGGNLRLTFKGVSHTASVYLDNKLLGEHYGAYGEFSFILKDIEDGVHTISVNTDNSYSDKSALHIDNDYYSYLGITRPVILEKLGKAYIKWIHITPVLKDGEWSVKIRAEIENVSNDDLKLELKFYLSESDKPVTKSPDANLQIQLKAGETKSFDCDFDCPSVSSYMPDNPVMYYLHGQLEDGTGTIDDLIERFGFRQVKVCGKEILFNGVPMKIKGFNRHEDYAEFGCSIPLSAMQRDIMLIKNAGANCIRTCHYPNDERFLDLCDENGIFVWEEAHARGLKEQHMLNPNFLEQSRLSITEMITNHFNHPSIYVWGLLNECASETEYGRECYKQLIELIKALDTSRPVTFASCKHFGDICLDLVDIVSYNIYPRWYRESCTSEFLSECIAYIRKNGGENKPIIISEIGAGAIYGYRTNTRCKWSEEGQVDMLEEQVSTVLENTDCNGVIIWQFADCRVDNGWAIRRPKTQNNKGVVDMYRREKLAYDKVKELYNKF